MNIIDNFLPLEIFNEFTKHAISFPHFVGVGHTAYTTEAYNNNFAEQQMQAIMLQRYINCCEVSDSYLHLEPQIKQIHKLKII